VGYASDDGEVHEGTDEEKEIRRNAMKIDREKLACRIDGGVVGMILGVLLFMVCLSVIGLHEDDVRLPECKCPDPLVELAEYKTVVQSLDRCNEAWRQSERYASENEFEIRKYQIIQRFQPDTTAAEDVELCSECSANCEEALSWCYEWREEACLCLDEWE
jgi:hypothetical protein